jgi:hypothetical protein
MEFKITGWKAIIGLVVVVAFVGFRVETQTRTLESQGVTKIRNWLMAESERAALPDMQKAMNGQAGGDKVLEDMAQKLQAQNFEIISVTSHGSGASIVARVKVRYKGGSHSDGMNVRYLRMQYSMVTGWRVAHEVSKWDYYMAVFGSPRSR